MPRRRCPFTSGRLIMQRVRISWLVLFVFVLAGRVSGADWPQFRGPGGLGVSDDAKVPTTWGDKKNLKWKLALSGTGMSSPIVVGNKVFVTFATEDGGVKRNLACVDRAKGSILWTKSVAAARGDRGAGSGI